MSNPHLARWQTITAATLFSGYVAYYVCRSNLSVCAPLIEAEFAEQGATKDDIGMIVSVGVALYALGKLINGLIADYVRGRTMFLFGMGASLVCTVLLGMSQSLLVFGILWGANRFVQSMGWVALVKTVSRWFPVERHATIMGLVSLSYLFGDALVRLYLGTLLSIGKQAEGTSWQRLADWRTIFFIAAATLAVMGLGVIRFLRSSPLDIGAVEPSANPANVFGEGGNSADPVPLRELLPPLLVSPVFWIVCAISCGLTLVRETFNFWTPTFLRETTGLNVSNAAMTSLVFPLTGGVAAIIGGLLSDRWQGRHERVVIPCVALLALWLTLLGTIDLRGRPGLALFLLCGVSFFLTAPYTLIVGVVPLDIAGKRGSSTASGLIDSAGYVGAILSGYVVGAIATRFGWGWAFCGLAAVSALTGVLTLAYWVLHSRQRRVGHSQLQSDSDDTPHSD